MFFNFYKNKKKVYVFILSLKKFWWKRLIVKLTVHEILQTYFMFVRHKFLHSIFNYDYSKLLASKMPLINIVEREKNSALFNQKIDMDISFILYCLRKTFYYSAEKS